MSDAWEEIQAVKSKRNSLREKLEKRKKERQNILGATLAGSIEKSEGSPGGGKSDRGASSPAPVKSEGGFFLYFAVLSIMDSLLQLLRYL